MSDNDSIRPSPDDEKQELIQEITQEIKNIESDSNPEWDGSEAEVISDDDAEEYEIPETGIRLSYVMTQDEMYRCIYHSDMIKTKGARAVIQSIILSAAAVAFFWIYFTSRSQYSGYNLFFGIVCLVMTAVIWIVPHMYMKSMAKRLADGSDIEAEIFPTHIDIGKDDGQWSIELDGKAVIQEFDNIIMIYTNNDRAFAIPERVIEPEFYNEIRAILMSGTQPDEED